MTPNPINTIKKTIHNTKHTNNTKTYFKQIQEFRFSKNPKTLYYILNSHNSDIFFVYFVEGLNSGGWVSIADDLNLGGTRATMNNSGARIMLPPGAGPDLCSLPGAYAPDGHAASCLFYYRQNNKPFNE